MPELPPHLPQHNVERWRTWRGAGIGCLRVAPKRGCHGLSLASGKSNILQRRCEGVRTLYVLPLQFRHKRRADAKVAVVPKNSFDAPDGRIYSDVVLHDGVHAFAAYAASDRRRRIKLPIGADDDTRDERSDSCRGLRAVRPNGPTALASPTISRTAHPPCPGPRCSRSDLLRPRCGNRGGQHIWLGSLCGVRLLSGYRWRRDGLDVPQH